MSLMGPGCVKTLTSNLRVEILSRLRRIGKEQHWQSQSKEEKGENNSAHSLLARVFTQPGSITDVKKGAAFKRQYIHLQASRRSLPLLYYADGLVPIDAR